MIKVRIDMRRFERQMGALAKRQLPFAAAKALTRTAELARDEVKSGLGSRFILRNKYFAQGITITYANKRDWPRLRAEVGVASDSEKNRQWAALQETGGVKRPHRGRYVAIPVRARKTKRQALPPSRWPGALAKRKRHTLGPLPGHPKRLAVYRTKGRGRRAHVVLLYRLVRRVRIKPRLGLRKTVRRVAAKHWERVFAREFRHALETARKK